MANLEKVDAKLREVIAEAAKRTPDYTISYKSGYRPGDKRQHGRGKAIDVTLVDKKTGKALPDYQDAKTFREYEKFAQTVRSVQQEKYPELDRGLRWGGYFSGGKGKYGALDLMHFDLAGNIGMGGGSWEKGLTKAQRGLFPGVQSVGMAALGAAKAGLGAVKAGAGKVRDAFNLPDMVSVPSFRPDVAVEANPNAADRPTMSVRAAPSAPKSNGLGLLNLAEPRASLQNLAPSYAAQLGSYGKGKGLPTETYHGAPLGAVERGGPLAAPSIRDMVANQARFAPEMPNPSRFGGATPPGMATSGLTAGVSSALRQEIGPMNAPTSIAMPTSPAGGYARAIGPQELPTQMAAPAISRPGMLPSQMTAPSLRMEAMLPASMMAPQGRPSFSSLPAQMAAPQSRPSLVQMAQSFGYPAQNSVAAAQAARQQMEAAKQQSVRGLLESMLGGGGRSGGGSNSGQSGGRSGGGGSSRAGSSSPGFSDRPSLW